MNKPKRPEEVYFCGQRWTLEFSDHALVSGTDQAFGETYAPARHIRIDASPGYSEQWIKQVTIHEATHAMHFTHGGIHPADEESCVRQLECPLITLLQDSRNRAFLRWVCKEN